MDKEFDVIKLIGGENQEQTLTQSSGMAEEEMNKLKEIKIEPTEEVEDKQGVIEQVVKEEGK